jgi:hypothetical protein
LGSRVLAERRDQSAIYGLTLHAGFTRLIDCLVAFGEDRGFASARTSHFIAALLVASERWG